MDLSHLNEAQKQAVIHTEGPLMILAGAGSGKTRTLVTKIFHLLNEKRIPSYNLLAMTFSNRAAREMKERIEHMAGDRFGNFFITTFHSFCSRLLRSEADYLGLSRNFTIYDDSETLAVIKNILSRRGISQKEISPHEVKYYISDIKNLGYFKGCEEHEYYVDETDRIDKDDLFFDLYLDYEKELHVSNAVDFGGLIIGALELFTKHPKIRERYNNRFKYLLVDEYQDTNRAQFLLLRFLTGKDQNICVVGDEDQSIYSWRGADINNILDFEKIFSDAGLIKLEQNYRSSKTIIEAASYVIDKNQFRKGKKLWTDNPEGNAIEVIECLDEMVEAEYVAKKIQQLRDKAISLYDTAVFYRTNSQSRLLEDALRRKKIPYKIVGGIKFYDRKEIKDALSYIKVVVNPKDSLSLSRIINSPPRGIGAVTLRKLETEAIKNGVSLYEMMLEISKKPESVIHLKLSKKVKASILEFVDMIEEVKTLDNSEELPSHLLERLLQDSGYLLQLKSTRSYENQARIDNLNELVSGLRQFEMEQTALGHKVSLALYLETVTLDNALLADESESNEGQVSLMTVHSSKGLEYEYVFLVGAEENIFPSIMSLNEGEEKVEEERRLFYVAMTRAMKELSISFCKGRVLWGKLQFHEPSRFIFEIPEDFIEWKVLNKNKSKKSVRPKAKKVEGVHIDYSDDFSQDYEDDFDASDKTYYTSSVETPEVTFEQGASVRHGLYGNGVVLKTEGYGPDEKVTIKFQEGMTKKFLLKYAPIEHM